MIQYQKIAKAIDHSLLKPTLTTQELETGCLLARRYQVATVCIVPFAVRLCAELLEGSAVAPSTTIGFPHGGHALGTKLAEATQALEDGALELDAVVNIGKVLSGDWPYVEREISELSRLTHAGHGRLKIIFETCYLGIAQKRRLCRICAALRVDWIKTSTGFGTAGATREDVELMLASSPPEMQVKASGGIRSLDQVLSFMALGASRIGTSSTREILEEAARHSGETQ